MIIGIFNFLYSIRLVIYFLESILYSFSLNKKQKITSIKTPLLIQRKKNICVFSHYDKNAIIQEYVVFYLKSIFEAGCNIIFVTTSPIDSVNQEKILEFSDHIIIRENIGLDFCSYKIGIESISDFDQYEKLILANDSVYGPFYPISELINFGEKDSLDIWGATDSYELSYHIQSYFLVFSQKAKASKKFDLFWRNVKSRRFKWSLIYEYEVGGSQYFLKNGFKLGALCSYDFISRDIAINKILEKMPNMTLSIWDHLIRENRYPFIKRMLLTINPYNVNNKWMLVVQENTNYNPDLILKSIEKSV